MISFAFFQILILSTVRNLIGPLVPVIASDLNIGLDLMGSALSASMFGVLFASFLTGSLIEVFGLKRVSITGFLLTAAGTTMLVFSKFFYLFIVSYFILQIGVAIIIIAVFSIAKNYNGRNKSSVTIKVMIGNVTGFALAPLFAALILFLKWNWHYFFLFSLIPQLFMLILLFRRDLPRQTTTGNGLKELAHINKKLLGSSIFVTCAMMGFFYESIMFTFYSWFTSYFSGLNITPALGSIFLSFFSIAVVFSMIIKSKIVFRFPEKTILLYSFFISLGLLLAILFLKNLVFKNISVFLLGIVLGGNFSLIVSYGVSLFPAYSNSASGLMVAFSNLGVIIFQYMVGYFSEHFSRNSVIYINLVILFILSMVTIFLRKIEIRTKNIAVS